MILSYATNKVSIFPLKILPLLPSLNFKQFFISYLSFSCKYILKNFHFYNLGKTVFLFALSFFICNYLLFKNFPPISVPIYIQQCTQLGLFSYKQWSYSCLCCTPHVFQFQNSQYGTHNRVPPLHITKTTPTYSCTLIGRLMFSCSLTENHQNHHLNHLSSARALLHTPWPPSGFSLGLSLWPKSRRRSVSICPALLVCDPVTKNGDVRYWQD